MKANGSGQKNLTKTPDFLEWDPARSPRGDQIAYTRSSCEGGANFGSSCVYVMAANGSRQTNLTRKGERIPGCDAEVHHGNSQQPAWSPDGSRIAYSGRAFCPGGGTDIWTMNADGSDKTNLTGDVNSDTRPAFSPDGRKLLFLSNRDTFRAELYTMSVGGSGIKRLTSNDIDDLDPDWGPAPPRRV